MADPPPEDPSGHRPLVQPAFSDLPQPVSPELPKSGIVDDSSGHSQPSEVLCRPPLAELNGNGWAVGGLPPIAEVVFTAKAIHKKPTSVRPAMVTSHRKFKKMKTVAPMSQPYQPHSNDDLLQQKPKDSVVEDRVELLSDAGIPAVVHPLQTIAAVEVPPGDGDESVFSDYEEDDEEFDLDAYQVDEKKRAELRSLMDKYGVYDEEQLRLAIRRERKQQKIPATLTGIPPLSSESAPTSPSGNPSRFIPPSHENLQPYYEDHSTLNIRLLNGNPVPTSHNIPTCQITHHLPNSSPPITMHTLSCHVPTNDVVNHPSTSANSHACTSHANLVPSHATLNPMHPRPPPCNPEPHAASSPMHQSTPPIHSSQPPPIPHADGDQSQRVIPSPDSGPMDLGPEPSPDSGGAPTPCSRSTPHSSQIDQAQPLKFFANNPLAMGDLTDFPPLPKGASVSKNGSNGDTVMVTDGESEPWPNGDPRHVTPAPPVEQTHKMAPATAPRHPTSLAERIKGSAPPTAPVAFNPSKFTPIGAKGDREGMPVVSFSKTDTECLAGRVGLAVVGKFSHSIPSSHNINKALNNIPIRGTLTWNFLNAKHVLIMLSDVADYAKLLHGVNGMPVWYVESVPMRVFKWTPEFDPSFETPIVAVWCNLPALPIHLYDQRALYMICSSLGNPIQVDHATAARTRITYARVCVEIDITKPPVEEFMIDMAGVEVRQKVVWDKIPRYCSDCKHVGHLPESCYAFGRNARPVKKAAPQTRTPVPRAKGVSRDTSSAHGASTPPAPSKAPHDSSGSRQRSRAPGDRPAQPQPRSPSRGHGPPGSPRPQHDTSGAPAPARSPPTGSVSGLRPLRMGERHLRSSSRSPSRAPVSPGAPMAPGVRGAPRSPPRAPTAPVVSRARGGPYAPVGSRDTQKRHSSPRSSHGHTLQDTSLGEWIEVAQSKHKISAREGAADVLVKNSFMVLDDGTEMLVAEYESEDDQDVEMRDDSKDMPVGSAQGSSTPNRGCILPASIGGNLRSGVSAPASS